MAAGTVTPRWWSSGSDADESVLTRGTGRRKSEQQRRYADLGADGGAFLFSEACHTPGAIENKDGKRHSHRAPQRVQRSILDLFPSRALVCAAILAMIVIPARGQPADLQDIPAEVLDEMAEAHPAMKKLLQVPAVPPDMQNRTGTSYVCVSQHEYKAAAMDPDIDEDLPEFQYTDGTFFCQDYVDYAAVCDQNDPAQSCNNRFAKEMYGNFERALQVYSCKQYSRIWTCKNCLAAYKRWMCTQVYKKFVIPDTEYVEEGKARLDAPTCECVGREPVENRDCVRICNGVPTGCITSEVEVTDQCWQPTCGGGENGVGSSVRPGLCRGYVYLDPRTASSEDGFYVGAKVEMRTGQMQGWWAVVQEYSGFAKIAMFNQWVPAKSKETETPLGPKMDDEYRIYLTEKQRGYCRNFSNPLKRLGPPCEQSPVFSVGGLASTGLPTLPMVNMSGNLSCPNGGEMDDLEECGVSAGGFAAPAGNAEYKYPLPGIMGGLRCEDDQKCVAVPRSPSEPENQGFACCKKSGYEIQLGEYHLVYSLQPPGANLTTGSFPFYACAKQEGNDLTEILNNPGVEAELDVGPAPWAQPAIEISGCQRNFRALSEKAVDDCTLKTCAPVCADVVRRCPRQIQFMCPERIDYREYESTICNMGVPHGCLLQVQSGISSQSCVQLNPNGRGPEDHPDMLARGFLTGSAIYGLPEEPRCYGFRGLSIDTGDKNPPHPPDARRANASSPYDFDIWCPDAVDPELKVREELDELCREMRYEGFYQEECYPTEG